jgi:teichuronic acid biosynthesis glycosyltransferase TuaC
VDDYDVGTVGPCLREIGGRSGLRMAEYRVPMRILTTTMCYPTPDCPDQGVFVQRRTAALARRHDVVVVAPQPWCPILRHPAPRVDLPPVYYPRMFSIPVLGWATDGLAYARSVCGQARRVGSVDLIDAHFEYPDGVGACRAARRLGIPVIVTLRGKLVSLAGRACRRAQIKAMLRSADALIAVSASLAALARQIAGRDLHIDVIPNGVDSNMFHPVDRAAARAALGWDADARYVLCVGHYQRLKGFDRLVAAWPAVRAAVRNAHLVLVGSQRGERGCYAQLQRLVVSGGLQSCVTLRGPADPAALNLMYAAADVSVNASRSEGWCNAIGESLAVGTPVIATDVGGNREQIGSPELGAIVPDGDLSALSAAISAGVAREWNRRFIVAHGAARTWDHVADEVSTVFERVLRRRSAAARAQAPLASACRPVAAGGGR